MKVVNIIVVVVLIACVSTASYAQYFQFSQYNFTPQRINPAQVAGSDFATMSFDFRNQSTEGGFHLTSNMVNASYPLISKSGRRWSGVGISLMDDRSGQSGIFNTQEVGLSYALNVPLATDQTISLGFKGVYQNREFDLGGLYTGSQYIPDRGFSESLTNGENIGQFVSNYVTFSAGLYWQKTNKQGNEIAYWGISFFDFNKPRDAFMDIENELNSTVVASVGFRAYGKGPLTLFPEILLTHGVGTNVWNGGLITRYDLQEGNQIASHVDIITKYVFGRSGIIGLQFHRENISVGFSYDFPVIVKNVANTGAFEIGLELRKLVKPTKRKNKNAGKKPVKTNQIGKVKKQTLSTQKVPVEPVTVDTTVIGRSDSTGIAPNPAVGQDSTSVSASAGKIQHEALILEKASLKFGFDFNSTELNPETENYLNDLALALRDNPTLTVRLIGHTDNIGSEKFNLRLSMLRAQKLKDFLLKKGASADKVSVEGRGMGAPLNGNKTDQERSANRRVELIILQN